MFSILFVLISIIFANAQNTCGESCTWTFADGTLTIEGTGEMVNLTSSSEQPWIESASSITSVVIGEGITTIGKYSFCGLTALETVTIAASVNTLNDYAFDDCTIIKSIEYKGTNAPTCGSWEVFSLSLSIIVSVADGYTSTSFCDLTTTVCGANCKFTIEGTTMTITGSGDMEDISYASYQPWYSYSSTITTVKFSEGFTSIATHALDGFSALTSVTIPSTVTKIGNYAFQTCSQLTEISIPSIVTSIGTYAFYGCKKLSSITIPSGVTRIETYALASCSLTSIVIPNSVTYIGDSAFSGNSSLTDVYFTGTEEEWNAITISSGNSYLKNATIHYNHTGN